MFIVDSLGALRGMAFKHGVYGSSSGESDSEFVEHCGVFERYSQVEFEHILLTNCA